MSLTTRVLPPAEWPRLSGTELEAVWPHLHPQTGTVLVVEDDGQIVGTWALLYVRHAEGCWVSPDHRGKTGVARRLLLGMRELAGDGPLFTAALSDDVREMLGRLHAQKLPGDHYVLNLGGGELMPAAVAVPLIAAGASTGAQLFGAHKAAGAAKDAARLQSQSADRAMAMMHQAYQPYLTAGGQGMNTLARLMTPGVPYNPMLQQQDAAQYWPTQGAPTMAVPRTQSPLGRVMTRGRM